jgi:hypothetical protein
MRRQTDARGARCLNPFVSAFPEAWRGVSEQQRTVLFHSRIEDSPQLAAKSFEAANVTILSHQAKNAGDFFITRGL